ENVETKIFATIPEHLRMKGRRSGWAFGKDNASMHSFLEGPAFDREGNLYVVDIPYGRILRVSPAGEFSVAAEYEGWPNGLAIHRDGLVFIADHLLGIMVLGPESGKVSPVL